MHFLTFDVILLGYISSAVCDDMDAIYTSISCNMAHHITWSPAYTPHASRMGHCIYVLMIVTSLHSPVTLYT